MIVDADRDRGDREQRSHPTRPSLPLDVARAISAMMYLGALAACVVVGAMLKPRPVSGLPQILPWLLLVVAVADYGVSLAIEGVLLSGKGGKAAPGTLSAAPEGRAATATIVVSAFGVSIGIYGIVLAFLSLPRWSWAFYALCLLHGIHLQLRWDRYEEAARRGVER
jgi:hypothetical protein